jgi:signal transduction histidine kinase
MRHEARDDFQAWLGGQILLFGLLGASLALFVSKESLPTHWELPELRLVLQTTVALACGLIALLSGVRFAVDARRRDLLLSTGFFVACLSAIAFSVAPVVGGQAIHRTERWAHVVALLFAWALIAGAPFAHGRAKTGRRALGNTTMAAAVLLLLVWAIFRALGDALPALDPGNTAEVPPLLLGSLAAQALLNLLAVVGFGLRVYDRKDDLDRWLGLGSTLMLFASLNYLFTPLLGSDSVSQADFLRVLAFGVLLVGAWRAIRFAEFGRAVAEERARVAREIHDGLAQYLFAVATHVTMLEDATPEAQAETIGRLKEAATAAQQEARFAILALSSASGTAPFDAALRRYVDFLTADGVLEVDIEIDGGVPLAPDEQIEVFRIVQEGLANVRKHANATRAEVVIGDREGERFVSVRDDGEGFDGDGEARAAGQGLKNMRARADSIEGGFSVTSRPGWGTALEVVLRV